MASSSRIFSRPRTSRLDVVPGQSLARHTSLKIGGPATADRSLPDVRGRGGVPAAPRASSAFPGSYWGKAPTCLSRRGLDALVLNLEGELATLKRSGTRLLGGGGCPGASGCARRSMPGLAGIECLGGIPGTLGGALAMNAGAYGQESWRCSPGRRWSRRMETVRRMERWRGRGRLQVECPRQGDGIVTRAEFALRSEDPETPSRAGYSRCVSDDGARLPPEPSARQCLPQPSGRLRRRLLDLAGCKGLRRGGAVVSQQHANVVVNAGSATAREVRELVAAMAHRVRSSSPSIWSWRSRFWRMTVQSSKTRSPALHEPHRCG